MVMLTSNHNATKLSFLKTCECSLENHKMWIQRKQSSGGKATKPSHHWAPRCFAAPEVPQCLPRDLHWLSLFNKYFVSYFWLQRTLRALTESSCKNKPPVWGNLVAVFSLFWGWRGSNCVAQWCWLRFPSASKEGSWKAVPVTVGIAGPGCCCREMAGDGEWLGTPSLGLAFKATILPSCCELSILPKASCSFTVTFTYISSLEPQEQEKGWD